MKPRGHYRGHLIDAARLDDDETAFDPDLPCPWLIPDHPPARPDAPLATVTRLP